MSVDTKSSIMDKKCASSAGTTHQRNNPHHQSSASLGHSNHPPVNGEKQPTTACSGSTAARPNDIEQLKLELDHEKRNRNQTHCEYAELKRQMDEYAAAMEEARNNPVSKYDPLIAKQDYFNDTLSKQIMESKDKLKEMSHELKHAQTCGKECNIHMRDLIIDYHCISKEHCKHQAHQHHHHHHTQEHRQHNRAQLMADDGGGPTDAVSDHQQANCLVPCVDGDAVDDAAANDLAKEIRRFQRMQIDLKSNLDRLQWRLDCESKIYHSVNDQYQKLQMDLYYLKNLNEKGRDTWQ